MLFVWTLICNLSHTASGESIFELRLLEPIPACIGWKSEKKTCSLKFYHWHVPFIHFIFQKNKVETWKANWCYQLLIYFKLLFNKQRNPSRRTRTLNCDWLLMMMTIATLTATFLNLHTWWISVQFLWSLSSTGDTVYGLLVTTKSQCSFQDISWTTFMEVWKTTYCSSWVLS